LEATAGVTVSGALLKLPETRAAAPSASGGKATAPAVLAEYTADDHRRRLRNIGVCNQAIRSCMRKHLVNSYLPGQCCYNLGEYPANKI